MPFPSPGDLPDPGIKPRSPTLQADALTSEDRRKIENGGVWCPQAFVFVLQEYVSPVVCKFRWLYGGEMATSSRRTYAVPRSTAPRTLASQASESESEVTQSCPTL